MPAIAYAALGHLHLAQSVGKQPHLRYCGSPLPMSFAEIGYHAPGAARRPRRRQRRPASRRCRCRARSTCCACRQQPAPLEDALAALAGAADLPDAPRACRPYLEVRVRLDAPEPGLRARIEAALEGKPVRLAQIDTSLR